MILAILPNQLFSDHPGLREKPSKVVLLEDALFFGDWRYPAKFHKQKLWLHRASMKRYESEVKDKGFSTQYVDYDKDSPKLVDQLQKAMSPEERKGETLAIAHPTDFIFEKRLRAACDELQMELKILPNPGFLNTPEQNNEYRSDKSRWFMADFYKWQRKRLDVLMDGDDPVGDQWSFDEDNRKKVPKELLSSLPPIPNPKRDAIDEEAVNYVQEHFGDHPGEIDTLYYPTSRASARYWLSQFLEKRLGNFGDYEDAIVQGESWLWHSVLTPTLNIGLLTPDEVLRKTLSFAEDHDVPLNSLEGFVRQIIGWREFIRATYQDLGVKLRTTNHWKHHRPMPACFYDATTGIEPIDETIRRVLQTGYCHHIERLMVLGGFMFLCEIDPDDIYRWFMEMFVDSYDWVMVPNAYAMSQNADGGLITTKPYFSGSSYIKKMSHYKSAPWCDTWDGLYWRWIWNHTEELGKNPRWAMMCSMAEKMDQQKRDQHLENAERFLEGLE
ncbi:Deoxyribodipyrimidine photo-lyase-related protein [Stieleria maiorica]|uniref:Deoxyribodipyrimidine photo-lyase-related protein n=1 Tax=Stieleria maiorica TaxID=2795974 RepID=A0A5B9MMY0_9BACT|nr:cryptochrome/photolyase family protein [Stieleria maiorica]QEG02729.1 Deoxyribodipyrimidine photo-lyase-related protein [Stieleria maiorica]